MSSFCEHGDEPSVSLKEVGYFFENLSDCSFSNNVLHYGVSK
jgi:hypothetical protein